MTKLIFFMLVLMIISVNCTRIRLTCAQRVAFVEGHNRRRFQAAQGLVPRQPPGSDLKYMIWDDELAEKATRWSETGQFSHNPDRSIFSRRWDLVGENVHTSTYCSTPPVNVIPDIEEALNDWFNEHLNYGFEPFELGTPLPIGHYTQMVWADSSRVGCGISQAKANNCTTTLIVCNYGPTGNFFGAVPYKPSPAKGFLSCNQGECLKPYGYYC